MSGLLFALSFKTNASRDMKKKPKVEALITLGEEKIWQTTKPYCAGWK